MSMNLKPIVAAILFSGMVSGSAFAGTTSTDTQAQLNAMQMNIAKMQAMLDQNKSVGGYNLPDWFNRISISGLANFDAAIANRVPTQVNTVSYDSNNRGTASVLNVNNVNLLIDADVSDWVKTHVGLLYGQNSPSFLYSSANATTNTGVLDEAYATFGNFSRTPIYFRIGREYVPFGDYNRFAMTEMVQSLPMLMSKTQATAAQLGFVDNSGFYGSAYLLRGLTQNRAFTLNADRTKVQNFGLQLGFANSYNAFNYKLSAGYLNNMVDVDYIRSTAYAARGAGRLSAGSFTDRVGGLSLNGRFSVGPFDASADYVAALQSFSVADLTETINRGTTFNGAKPAAWGLDVGYSFPVMNHNSRVGLGYQGSKQSAELGLASGSTVLGIGLPRVRYLANYVVNVTRCTDVGFEVYRDLGYGRNNLVNPTATTVAAPTREQATLTGVLRLGVRFS